MTDSEPKRRVGWLVPTIVFGGLALYVFSLGPYVLLASRGLIPPTFSRIIGFLFLPLGYLHQYVPPIGELLDWYIELWSA